MTAVRIHCCKWPNYDFWISQGSVQYTRHVTCKYQMFIFNLVLQKKTDWNGGLSR